MEELVWPFIICILAFILAWLSNELISWTVHVNMTKANCDRYGWGNRKIFWENFHKYKLEKYNVLTGSFFGEKKSKFHANIIVFNNVGMLLNPIDWIWVKLEIKMLIRKINKKRMYS